MKFISSGLFTYTFIFFAIATFASCEKYTQGEGTLMIGVKYEGSVIGGAMVYLKRGTLSAPNIPYENYDIIEKTNGKGRIILEGVKPDKYFIHVKEVLLNENREVAGNDSLAVRQRFRENAYNIVIETQ